MRDRVLGVPDHAWEPPDALALPTVRDLAEESVEHAVHRLVGQKGISTGGNYVTAEDNVADVVLCSDVRIVRLLIAAAKTAVELEKQLEEVREEWREATDSDAPSAARDYITRLKQQIEGLLRKNNGMADRITKLKEELVDALCRATARNVEWQNCTGCEDPDAAADSMALLGEEVARLRQERDDACERSVLVAPAVDRLRDLEHRLGLRHDDLGQEVLGDPDEAGPAESSDTECGGGADPDRDRQLHVYGRMLRAYRLIRGAAIEATRGGEVSDVTRIGWRSRVRAARNWVDAEAPASELDRAVVEALAEAPELMPAADERAAIADWIEVELGGRELAALIRDAVHLEWEEDGKNPPDDGPGGAERSDER